MIDVVRRLARTARATLRPGGQSRLPVPADGAIRKPGRYRLDRDIVATGHAAIEIAADNVDLDLGGHRVTAAVGSHTAPTFAILAPGVSNLEIHSGTLAQGWFGVDVGGVRFGRIRAIQVVGFDQIGIVANAAHDLSVEGCHIALQVKDIVRPAGERYTIGMNLNGQQIKVTGNTVEISYDAADLDQQPIETIGILIGAGGRGVDISANRMAAAGAVPASYGVWGGAASEIRMSGNRIENLAYGIAISDRATAFVSGNDFSCSGDPSRIGTRDGGCNAAMFARAARLTDLDNQVAGYASRIIRYEPEEARPKP